MPISKIMQALCLCLASCALTSTVSAADTDSTGEKHPSNLSDQIQASGDSKMSKPMPAQVQVVEVELSNVRDLLMDLKRARTAANNLYEEMSRHPVSVNNVGNVIGSVVTTIPTPTMNMTQTLPARKQWVDMYMGQVSPIVSYMQKDLESVRGGESKLHFPSKAESALQNQLKNWGDDVDKAAATTAKLTELTASEPYRNDLVVRQLTELQKSLGAMEKTGKNVIRILKKSQ